jgi:lipoprotein-anchoring transpeptidase ErfK/SrfK
MIQPVRWVLFMNAHNPISRRRFLSMAGLAAGGLALPAWLPVSALPTSERLGRVNVGMAELKLRPDQDGPTVRPLYQDTVVPWVREVVGRRPFRINQRWVETDEGYVWAAYLQPVRNLPNPPLASLPVTSLGAGMWAEITVPYVDVALANPPARSPWLQNTERPRLYYRQVFWIDQIKTNSEGKVLYRVNERFGYGDLLWADAEGFRPLTEEEISPIHPEIEEKRVVVDVTYQTMSCFEGKNEVYYARVSTGMKNDLYGNPVDKWSTPPGRRPIWRKLISVHMTGGSTGGGYDLPGVSWTSLFEGNGVAIHSTYWHNNFGEPMSHGCVNASPEDAQWVFRWTQPVVAMDPGDVTVTWPGGTIVEVVES